MEISGFYDLFYLIKELIKIGRLYQIYENVFLIFEKIGVVGYTFFTYWPQAFKKLRVIVVYTYPEDVRGNFNPGHFFAPPFPNKTNYCVF
jgi:hypothetical protein